MPELATKETSKTKKKLENKTWERSLNMYLCNNDERSKTLKNSVYFQRLHCKNRNHYNNRLNVNEDDELPFLPPIMLGYRPLELVLLRYG